MNQKREKHQLNRKPPETKELNKTQVGFEVYTLFKGLGFFAQTCLPLYVIQNTYIFSQRDKKNAYMMTF